MKKFTVVATNGRTFSIIAEEFERNPQLGRLAFRIGDSNVAMFELSNIVGFRNIDQGDEAPEDKEDAKAHWVRRHDDICYWTECSFCGRRAPLDQWRNEWESPFCPCCGKKME